MEQQTQKSKLLAALTDYRVLGSITDVHVGPTVTTYSFVPERGTRHARVASIAEDIARCLAVASCRVSLIPNTSAVGIELPNDEREPVYMAELLASEEWLTSEASLPMVLGRSMLGAPVVADLATMPHLLIAGTTGSGKSVGIHSILVSLLSKYGPDKLRLILVDPKQLEFKQYGAVPHLLAPVLTNPSDVVNVLHWTVGEMKRRYAVMSDLSVRNIAGYNAQIEESTANSTLLFSNRQVGFDNFGNPEYGRVPILAQPMPYIVIVIDEVADLMLAAKVQVESIVQRLAQMARAAGIHLVLATQRPSVDVITGTIKANFPSRISFRLHSKIDSRTILGQPGAEQLFGNGDMLLLTNGEMQRIQGAFVTDDEVQSLVARHSARQEVAFLEDITSCEHG
jgi:S-DNA-T family DNA segregation ATPase FtsK/SpoIIIE